MDLILPIISGLGILGYTFNKNGRTPDRVTQEARTNVLPNDKNSSINTYSSVYSKEISQAERALAQAKGIQSQDPASTNVIPPFYNDHCSTLNTCNITQLKNSPKSILPEITNIANPQDTLNNKINSIMNSPMFNAGNFATSPMDATSGGFTAISKEAFSNTQGISELTGCTFENTHNNMVPFFGGSVKQNTDENKTQATLDRYTGNDRDLQAHKIETSNTMAPYKQNIFGTQPSQERDRHYQSNLKTNLLPLPQIKEAPLPADSFRGTFKTVNQLQVKQKTTNKSATPTAGLKIAVVSQQPAYAKNKPETSYVSGIQRTVVSGPIAQDTRLNYTNGSASVTENNGVIPAGYTGDGLARSGPREIKLSEISSALEDIDSMLYTFSSDDRRDTDKSSGFRNIGSTESKYNELAREGFQAPNETERDTTYKPRLNNAVDPNKGNEFRNNQRARTTNKETTLFSYTGDAISNNKATTGYHGKQTRKTQKVGAKGYLAPASGRTNPIDNSSYERSVIRSNRENVADTGNYDISIKGSDKLLGGTSVPASGELYGNTHFKNGIHEKNEREYGNNNRNKNEVIDSQNYGITHISKVKGAGEIDSTDRISDVFLSQLIDNDLNIDIKTRAKASKIVHRKFN
jgi:hypothetical protein